MSVAEGSFVSLADIVRGRPAVLAPRPVTASLMPASPLLVDPSDVPLSTAPPIPLPAFGESVDETAPSDEVSVVAEGPPALTDSEPVLLSDEVGAAAAVRDARLFRAALADVLEQSVADMLERLAEVVLARELRLDPVDLGRLASRLLAECLSDEPVRLRVAPTDAHITCDLPILADAALRPGDAVLECRSGGIDARLAVRLAQVLAAVRP